jgi:hypothetical protein
MTLRKETDWDSVRRFAERSVMSINIELSIQEVALLKQITKLDNEADAVMKAAREFLRLCRLRELKAVSGKVEIEAPWQDLEAREIDESGFPR